MSQPIISVENLSKAYRIGLKEQIPDTMVGAITGLLTAPFRNFHRLRRLNTYSELASSNQKQGTKNEEPRTKNHEPPNDILWALRDVSFDIHEGEVLGIIGRNGAGKSTLLKILSRITDPTAGQVVIRGRVSSLLEVGTGFHPEMTGRENVYMNGTILGMSKREIDGKFDEIVDFSGVERFLDTPVKRYSSGMKVRLAFAVAAHLEPEILIIDEVLAVGDAEFQKKCLGKMEDVAGSGRTVLFVSHNMGAVQALCTRGVLLRQGQLVVDGPLEQAFDEYVGYLHRTSGLTLDNPERSGTGEARLTAARLLDHEGRETQTVTAGLSACLEFEYENIGSVAEFSITATILDGKGIPITNLNSAYGELRLKPNGRSGRLSCKIPRVPLLPGTYRIAVALQDGGKNLDLIPNVILFTVDSSVFFATSRVPLRQYCACMVDHAWTHEPSPPIIRRAGESSLSIG
jgi:lipopolysaccharide transport system ATP-binding protein